jgi:hypothetical protein
VARIWRLTFDMSGMRKRAKPAGACPLDGRVRRHLRRAALFAGNASYDAPLTHEDRRQSRCSSREAERAMIVAELPTR